MYITTALLFGGQVVAVTAERPVKVGNIVSVQLRDDFGRSVTVGGSVVWVLGIEAT